MVNPNNSPEQALRFFPAVPFYQARYRLIRQRIGSLTYWV